MSGEGITQLIFFIAAIIIAVGVIGVVTTNVNTISTSYGMNSKTLADQLKTDITIINDPSSIPWVSNNHSFYVKNTGKNTLDITTISMFVDGNYTNVTNKMTIMETNSVSPWYPTYVLRINYSTRINSPPYGHILRVVVGNGIFDTITFNT